MEYPASYLSIIFWRWIERSLRTPNGDVSTWTLRNDDMSWIRFLDRKGLQGLQYKEDDLGRVLDSLDVVLVIVAFIGLILRAIYVIMERRRVWPEDVEPQSNGT